MHTNQKNRQGIACVLAIMPAVLLGIAAMIFGGVSPVLWGQQIAALVVVLLLTALARHTRWKIPAVVWAGVLLVILAAALFGPEAGGVRRWVKLGPFNVNAAMLVLPSMLVLLGETACFYPLLAAAGCAALTLVPAFWGWRFCRERKAWQLSLAVYEAVMILFGLTGQYPVPFMGFGLSPIVGYGLFCLLECRLENV